MAYTTLTLERDGPLGIITFNRPDKMNSLSDPLLADLRDAIAECEKDVSVRALIITGSGKAFSAGFDIAPKEKPRSTVDDWRSHAKDGNETNWRIWRSRLPVVAAVNGYCLGGGCDMSMACDFTIAASSAQFGEPEIEFSSATPFLIMPWAVGMKHAKQMMLLGERIDANEAHRMGIVNKVVPDDELMAEARKVALRLARLPAAGINMVKEAINKTYELRGMAVSMTYAEEMFSLTAMNQTPEGAEFRKIAREQGLKAAIKWREERFK